MSDQDEKFIAEATPVQNVVTFAQGGRPGGQDSWADDKTEVITDLESSQAVSAWLMDDENNVYEMNSFPFVIGRSDDCDFVPQGRGISRRHVEISFHSGRFVITDLDSLNGLKVNGYKVSRVILEDDDAISIGDCKLNFCFNPPGTDVEEEKLESSSLFSKLNGKGIKLAVVGFAAAGLSWAAINMLSPTSNDALLVSSVPQQAAAPEKADVAKPAPESITEVSSETSIAPASAEKDKAVQAQPRPVEKVQLKPLEDKDTTPVKVAKVTKVEEPVVVEQKPTVVKSKQSTADRRILASIGGANKRYLNGDAEVVIDTLKNAVNNKELSSRVRNQAKAKLGAIEPLLSQYQQGVAAFEAGDKEKAFSVWTEFLNAEKRFLGGSKNSVYAGKVEARVVNEYLQRADSAKAAGNHREAYRLWQSAVELGNNQQAKMALSAAEGQARSLYRKGLKFEYVNSEKAKDYWLQATELVPESNEYYGKASEKLAWYNRWGVE